MEIYTGITSQQMSIKSLFERSEMRNVPIGQLKESSLNTFGMTEITEMKQSILTYGLLTPLTVWKDTSSDTYEVLSGNRRFRAIKELKEKEQLPSDRYNEIPCLCLIDDNMSDVKKQLVIEIANLDTRKGVDETSHRFRVVECLKELAETGEVEERKIIKNLAEYIGTSERYAAMYKAIFENPNTSVKEATESGKISVSDAARLSSMNEDIQQKAIDKIIEADDKKTAKAIVKNLAAQERMQKSAEKGISSTENANSSKNTIEKGTKKENPIPFQSDNSYNKESPSKSNTDAIVERKNGTLQEASDNIDNLDKDEMMALFRSDAFGMGIGLEEEFDHAVSDVAAAQNIDPLPVDVFDYETFSDLIDELLAKDTIEQDTPEADAVLLCHKIAEKFPF